MRFKSLISIALVAVSVCMSSALYAQTANDDQAKAALDQANGAIRADNEMLAQYPTHAETPKVALHLAHCYEMTKHWTSALDTYNMIASKYPDDPVVPEANYNAAQRYWAKRDYDTAIQKCSDVVTRFPKSSYAPGAQFKIGMLYVAKRPQGKTPEEKADFKNKADAAFAKVVELYPNDKELCAKVELQRSGIAFERALDGAITWDAAVKQIQAAKEACPNAPKSVSARIELILIEKDMLDHKYADVATNAEKFIDTYSTCKLEVGWARLLAGNARVELGNYDKALAHYQAVIDGKYTSADNFSSRNVTSSAMVYIGDCYTRMGQPDKAKEEWQGVISSYPDSMDARVAKGRLNAMSGGNIR